MAKAIKAPKLPAKPKAGKKPKASASAAAWERYIKNEEAKISAWSKKVSEIKKAHAAKVAAAEKQRKAKAAEEAKKKSLIAKAAKLSLAYRKAS